MRKIYRDNYMKEASAALDRENLALGRTADADADDEGTKIQFFLCHYCGLRFNSQKALSRHKVSTLYVSVYIDIGCIR
jgi:hypothetical protein